ncbi:MAG: hypothetical protein RL404_1718 [Pseudomonadota bacterium]|jgi:Flp pilus assembly protein TadD
MNRRMPSPQAAKAQQLYAQGVAQHRAGNLADAQARYRQVLALMPGQPDALHMLGVTEFQQRRYDEAARLLSEASVLMPASELVHFNLGNALREQRKLDDAAQAFRKSVGLNPRNLEALKNLGNVLKEQNLMSEAIACYDRVLAAEPQHVPTLYNKSIALLTQGRLAEGWALYDYRSQFDAVPPDLAIATDDSLPDWRGELPDRPLLVLPEQGLGDQIFYGAMLADLQAAGVASHTLLDARLLPLFRRSFPALAFAPGGESGPATPPAGAFGAKIRMASMGRFLRSDAAGLSRIQAPYLLADSDASARLRAKIAQPGRLVCGLTWSSKNAETGSLKSLPLSTLQPVLQIPGVDFIDLQYGDTADERAALEREAGLTIRRLEAIDNQHDIDALAALIDACDLVITVSNSTAHLAAALGKPVVILLAHHTPLWYWHLDSLTSPWYPTATLLRQPAPGDWDPVVATAAHMLGGLLR